MCHYELRAALLSCRHGHKLICTGEPHVSTTRGLRLGSYQSPLAATIVKPRTSTNKGSGQLPQWRQFIEIIVTVNIVSVRHRHDMYRKILRVFGFFLMSNRSHGRHTKPDRHPGDAGTTRQRQCLMCRARFASTWSGERICQSCKRKSLWSSVIRLPSSSRPA